MTVSQSWIEVRVVEKRRIATDVVQLALAAPGGAELPPFSAGSHVDVELAPGLVRQYSLCNNPAERDRYEIAVLREPASRGGSIRVHDAIVEGQALRISAPRNHFPLEKDAAASLLIAGGIGITPILCMAERLAHLGADFELHYACRSPDRAAFRERIETAAFAGQAHFHYSDRPARARPDLGRLIGPHRGRHLYVCGPAGLIDAAIGTAKALGWPDASLHREYFVPPEVSGGGAEDGAFTVRLASSGAEFEIPAGSSILDVLRDAGIDVPASCEQGVCGTCLTRVLAGVPDHRDYFLTDEERARNDQFTPCCSRGRGLLVIDL